MRGKRWIVVLGAALALVLPAFASADGSAGQTTGEAHPTGVWASTDPFWTWTGAIWLHVTILPAGDALGSVQSQPYLIACPLACTRPYDPGSLVRLVAAPSAGAHFVRWDGGSCAGQPQTCTLTIGSDDIETAVFEKDGSPSTTTGGGGGGGGGKLLKLTVENDSGGTVTGNGISCPPTCSKKYPANTEISLSDDTEGSPNWNDPENGGNQGCINPYSFTLTSTRTVTVNDEC